MGNIRCRALLDGLGLSFSFQPPILEALINRGAHSPSESEARKRIPMCASSWQTSESFIHHAEHIRNAGYLSGLAESRRAPVATKQIISRKHTSSAWFVLGRLVISRPKVSNSSALETWREGLGLGLEQWRNQSERATWSTDQQAAEPEKRWA